MQGWFSEGENHWSTVSTHTVGLQLHRRYSTAYGLKESFLKWDYPSPPHPFAAFVGTLSPKSILAYKHSVNPDLAVRPALHLIYKKSSSCQTDHHRARPWNRQHGCLLMTHGRKKVPLLFKVLKACAQHSDADSESYGISLCCLRWHLVFSINFLHGANTL